MTVNTINSTAEFVTNGATITFPFFFKFLANGDLVVTYINAAGVSTVLALGTDYSVSGAGDEDGGSITTTIPRATGQLIISREMDAYQQTSLRNQGKFLAETHEDVFDRLTMLIQQGTAWLRRALVRPVGKNYYDAEQRLISNVADPVGDQDVANKRWTTALYAQANAYAYSLYLKSIAYAEALVAGVVGGYGSFIQAGNDAIVRTFQSKMRDIVSVRDFGAVGDYATDDTAAIIKADLYCFTYGKTLDFGDGVYRCTNGIIRKARWKGNFAPTLGTFPITADDKVFLRPGFKPKLPGASLIFSGTGTATATTSRADRFASFTYCLMDDPTAGTPHIEGIAVVMDMDVFDAGGAITSVAADNRAHYDVGYYGTTGWTAHKDFVVFGYFPKGGKFIFGADIDYSTYDENCSTSGDIGLTIAGNGANGLSGTRYEGRIFANDHHSRSIVDNQWGTCALYIDGNIPAASAPQNSIGGHYFSGSIRTYCNNPFVLDHANSIVFDGCVFEWPNMAGSTGATKALPVGSANTYGVVFNNCRHLSPVGVDGIYQFANSIGGVFIHSDPRHGNMGLSYAGVGAFLRSNGGNPAIQLTTDINGSTKGLTILENLSSSNRFEVRYENALMFSATTTGTLTANRLVGVLTGSSSAADPSVRLSGSDASTGFYRPGANNIAVSVAGTKVADWQADGILRPGADNTYSLGSGSFRFSQVYAATGTINTSDARLKTVRGELTEQEMEAWSNVRHVMFKYNDRIDAKGEPDARLHAGYLAQEVQQAFIAAGLDPSTYALWCEDDIRVPVIKTRPATRQKQVIKEVTRPVIDVVDGVAVMNKVVEVESTPAFLDLLVVDINGDPVFDGQGQQLTHQVPVMEEFVEEYEDFESNGTRMGLRYSECAIFDAVYLKTLFARLEQRIEVLEKE